MKSKSHSRFCPGGMTVYVLLLLIDSTGLAGQMAFPGEDWELATPESEGINSLRLAAAIDSLGKDFNLSRRSLAIVRNGRMVWQSPAIESLYPVRSVTKSFTSTALGLLIDDGAVTLDTKVASILPALTAEYPDVDFEHLATMTSGYHASYSAPWVPLSPYAAPGAEYNYANPPMDLMSSAMTQIAGESIADLFQRRIGDPIGITRLQWPTLNPPGSVAAVNRGGDELWVSPSDAARLGHLFLNRGEWDGQQLLGADWVDEATRIQVPINMYQPEDDIGIGPGIYGYNWWISGESPGGWRLVPSLPDDAYFASGDGDNLLFVVPQWDLIVAKTAYSDPIDVSVWDAFFRQVGNAVSPAESGTQFDLAPASIYAALDETFDGNGDSVIDLASAVDAQIGEVDLTASNYVARAIAKFSLPAAPAGKPVLAKATLAVYPTETGGNLSEPLSIWHSAIDNTLQWSPASFEDTSYVDTSMDIVQPENNPFEYYEMDVTGSVLADYAADEGDAMSAFRLQIDAAAFVEDDISHRYLVSMPGMTFRPQLLLTFIPEGIPGDFNEDGIVDGKDFLLWQRGESPKPLSQEDLADWQTHYAQSVDELVAFSSNMPEPSALLLCGIAAFATAGFSRRGRINRWARLLRQRAAEIQGPWKIGLK